uniref:VWFA domain-containing protein n=1 Tax=Oryza meridionalis TaxID=40149 RepID=A0A0E0F8R4_9ORYZ
MGQLHNLMLLLPCLIFSTLLHIEAMSVAAMKVSTTPIFPTIPRAQTNKDLGVTARRGAAGSRSQWPLLDVSSSMNDPVAAASPESNLQASRLDVLKASMKFIISKLDDGDRLSIVAFNDGPVKEYSSGLLDVSGDGRSITGKKIDRLQARGGTALMPALEEAVKILDERQSSSRNRVGFILLLTDGDDTTGFRWSRHAIHGAVAKYPVHTFGLGASHDPEPLLHIAQGSRGTYSFVDDDNLGNIAVALAVCLGGLRTVAAVDTRVSLKAAELSGGARIVRVDSGGYESSVACGGASGEVVVGVLYAGEVKNFVVHLHVPAASSTTLTFSSSECGYYCGAATVCDHCHHRHQQQLLAVGYSYSHAPGAAAAAVSVEGHGVFVERPEVAAVFVSVDGVGVGGGRQQQIPHPSPVVMQHMVRFELLELVAGFAEAEMASKPATTKTKPRAADVLQGKWEEFRRARQFWGGVELDGVEREVDAMVASLRGGLAYVSSWVSSHQMQRTTAMGSLEKVVAEFMTPAMVIMVEEARKLPPPPPPAAAAAEAARERPGGCDGGDDLHYVIRQRLELWSKVRREVSLMYQASSEQEDVQLTAVFREASLEAIDRAMHHDIYLAVVHVSNQRRC